MQVASTQDLFEAAAVADVRRVGMVIHGSHGPFLIRVAEVFYE
jgi:hypothetical protein